MVLRALARKTKKLFKLSEVGLKSNLLSADLRCFIACLQSSSNRFGFAEVFGIVSSAILCNKEEKVSIGSSTSSKHPDVILLAQSA